MGRPVRAAVVPLAAPVAVRSARLRVPPFALGSGQNSSSCGDNAPHGNNCNSAPASRRSVSTTSS